MDEVSNKFCHSKTNCKIIACPSSITRISCRQSSNCVSTNMRYGSVWTDKLNEMINQEFKALGIKYLVLPNFGICCRELRVLKVTSFCTCVRSFYSFFLVQIPQSQNIFSKKYTLPGSCKRSSKKLEHILV